MRGSWGWCAAVAAFGLLWFGSARAEEWPTNYELVRGVAHQACADLAGALGRRSTPSTVAVTSVGASPANFLVENTMSSALTEAGWQVRSAADSTRGLVLEFEVVDLGLTYPRSYRRAWLGEKRVEREARARLYARCRDEAGGSILWAEQAEARKSDEVPAEALAELEEKNPAEYVKATLPPAKWNKMVEPIVVTGIIAGLIVLFFSNQSGS